MVKRTPQDKKKYNINKVERRNVNIDSELVDQLKIIAINKGITLKQLCDEMAKREIKQNK